MSTLQETISPMPPGERKIMQLEQQYYELQRLEEEVNRRLAQGTDFGRVKELILYLAREQTYLELKQKEGRMIMLDRFLGIWMEEKQKLQDPGIAEDIFYQVGSLEDLAHKYQQILYCALRMENNVPEPYVEQAMAWLVEQRISGLAVGRIVMLETRDKEGNLLHIAQELKRSGEILNALLLLQYANEKLPGRAGLLLEEADCWLQGRQWERAYELLEAIEEPAQEVREIMTQLRQVIENGQ